MPGQIVDVAVRTFLLNLLIAVCLFVIKERSIHFSIPWNILPFLNEYGWIFYVLELYRNVVCRDDSFFFTPKCVIRLTGKQLILLLFKNWILAWMIRDTDYTDLPLILILSVYTDFSHLEFGKIHFLSQNLAKYRFFQECKTFFFTFSLVIQIFSREYWFSLSFILILCSTRVAGLFILQKCFFFFYLSQLSDVTDTLKCLRLAPLLSFY